AGEPWRTEAESSLADTPSASAQPASLRSTCAACLSRGRVTMTDRTESWIVLSRVLKVTVAEFLDKDRRLFDLINLSIEPYEIYRQPLAVGRAFFEADDNRASITEGCPRPRAVAELRVDASNMSVANSQSALPADIVGISFDKAVFDVEGSLVA